MNKDYLASLPWYDGRATKQGLDQFWSSMANALRDAGVERVPESLERSFQLSTLWQAPNLILSQCCGPDLLTPEGQYLSVIARPVFHDLDCQAGSYYSYIISGKHYKRGAARVAVNAYSSRSGYFALVEWMESNGIEISTTLISGSHNSSLELLEAGEVDLAAIDAHTFNQLERHRSLAIVGRSTEALTPPYVFHSENGVSQDVLFSALDYAVKFKGENVGVTNLVMCDRDDYSR